MDWHLPRANEVMNAFLDRTGLKTILEGDNAILLEWYFIIAQVIMFVEPELSLHLAQIGFEP